MLQAKCNMNSQLQSINRKVRQHLSRNKAI